MYNTSNCSHVLAFYFFKNGMRSNDRASHNTYLSCHHGRDHVHHHHANLEVKITISQKAIFGTGNNHENYV